MTIKRWPRTLLLASMYMMGILGIVASGGSGSDGGENFTCGLVTQDIAPATDGSGDIWIGLLTKSHLGEVNSVVRLSSNGSEQLSFAIGDEVWTLAIANDPLNANKVYVGGFFAGGILRLNEDGSLDGSFVVGSGFDGRVSSIVPATDGSGDIYVGGYFSTYNGTTVSGLVRLNSDGLLDNVFASSASGIESVALATDAPFLGYIYSGGRGYVNVSVARWNNSGTKDGTFNPSIGGNIFSITPAADASGAIYVGGNYLSVRLNSNGTTDGSFDTGTGFDAQVMSIVRADDMTGDIYWGGWFTTYDGTDSNGIVRLNDDGSRDVNFMIGSGFEYNTPFTEPDPRPYSDVASIARATDGATDVYVGGGFTHYNGVASNGIARLNSDGSLDTGFAVRISSGDRICSNQTARATN
jgi:uncharacterized delta-60 repeat protein